MELDKAPESLALSTPAATQPHNGKCVTAPLTSWLTYPAIGLPGLEGLNEDTFRVIAYEARGIDDALLNLSAVSRRLRELVMPILFARCWTDYYGNHGVPPPSIRPFVQYAVLAHVQARSHKVFISVM